MLSNPNFWRNAGVLWMMMGMAFCVAILGLWPAAAQDVPTVTPDQGPQIPELTATATETPTPTMTSTPTVTPTETATPIPLIVVTGIEPAIMTSGQDAVLSIFGANFTAETTVRLVGFGLLETTLVNSTALRAIVPAGILPGGYSVQVSDPVRGTAFAATILTVLAPPATPAPTREPPTLFPTPEPPTPVPGQPSLVVRNFSVIPESTIPGGTVTLTFEIVNQGNRAALGVSVAVSEGSKFVPANGQASATLPDIGPGGRTMVVLTVVVPLDATAGPNVVPLTMAYRDFSGQGYTSNASLSVTVTSVAEASQVVVTGYTIDPDPAVPGEPLKVMVSVMNAGNQAATQVLLRIAGSESVLLAGTEGDSFPLGDLAPGTTITRDLSLVVSTTAKAGPQSQPLTLSYLQGSEAKTSEGSITVNVAAAEVAMPLLLLAAYDTGTDTLRPGDQFMLTMDLQNVGAANVANLLVTFGIVDNSSGNGSGSGSPTTPSSTFAPLGTGGTIFVESIAARGGTATLSQEFIVSGSVASGIYTLPITLQYKNAAGEDVKTSLNASLVVVAPPLLQISLLGPIPEVVNMGEPIFVSLQITNIGEKSVNLTGANFEAENGEVVEGAEVLVGTLPKGEDVTVNGNIIPQAEGPVIITITLHYRNDLGREQTIVQTYETEAVAPPPGPDFGEPPPEITPEPTPEAKDNTIGRIIMGLLGLGS